MVHTLMINNRFLSSTYYNEVFKALESISKENGSRFFKGKFGYETNALREHGFNKIILKKLKIDERYRRDYLSITIILNPAKLIRKGDEYTIKEEDLEEIKAEFDCIKNKINIGLPSLENWEVNRIDYAINIKTRHVKEYIKLFQRGDKPKGFKEPYCSISRRRKQLEGSFYLFNKSVGINFYDKEDQLLKKNFNRDGVEDLLRLEIQCNKPKTNSIKYKKGFGTSYVKSFLQADLSEEYINIYYDKTIGSGDYYKLSKAIQMIEESNYTKTMKDKLVEVLRAINRHRSIWKAREKSKYSRNSFNKYLNMIRELNINPVTIPNEMEVDFLKNPKDLICIKE